MNKEGCMRHATMCTAVSISTDGLEPSNHFGQAIPFALTTFLLGFFATFAVDFKTTRI